MKPLEACLQHRAVDLAQEPVTDMYDAFRIDTHEVPVVGTVMDSAERETIDYRCDPVRLAPTNDVRGLHEFALLQ